MGEACGNSVAYLEGRVAFELPRRLEIRAGGGAAPAAAAEEAAEDPPGRRGGRVGRGPEEVLEDGHGEEHGDEDGGGHEPERHRAHAAVQLPPPHLLRCLGRGSSSRCHRPWPSRRGHRRPAHHRTPPALLLPVPAALPGLWSRPARRHWRLLGFPRARVGVARLVVFRKLSLPRRRFRARRVGVQRETRGQTRD